MSPHGSCSTDPIPLFVRPMNGWSGTALYTDSLWLIQYRRVARY
ncbi:Uncharacterised protein [Vibrio cholerae]|nr:Uncharacterised protein [Vibrio cholerae]